MASLCKCIIIVICVLQFYGEKISAKNLETRKYIRVKPTGSDDRTPYNFGTTLALRRSGRNAILYAGAPTFRTNGMKSGGVYSCPLYIAPDDKSEQFCSFPVTFEKSGAMGLTMDLDVNEQNLLVCGNQYTYPCGEGVDKTLQMIGSCYSHDVIRRTSQPMNTPCPINCPTDNPFRLVADIVFALDESGSVIPADFQRQLKWTTTLLDSFRTDIDSGQVQIGIILFNHNSRTAIDLREHTFRTLEDRISNFNRRSGGTDIEKAINNCRTTLSGSKRRKVAKEMILLTDGDSSGDILGAANRARALGITTVAVGVGSNTKDQTLLDIAGDFSRVFRATDFSNLDQVTTGLRNIIIGSADSVLEGQSTNSSNKLIQCQGGSSAHISAQENNVYIGALGAYDRSGTVIEYGRTFGKSDFSKNFQNYIDQIELERFIYPSILSEFKDSYLGYSITTGKFINTITELVASGAPRYKSRGVVLIYNPKQPTTLSPTSASYILHPSDEYWQLGAYFGHSVLSIDINKDTLDDLIVSAPLYSGTSSSSSSSSYDQGRVFVFTNNPTIPGIQGWMTQGFKPQVLKGSNAIGSRFGMSIAAVGDIDKNGYDDVIVGAPNEESSESESGAVYIYLVTADGISESNKQRVLGKSVARNLRGFGGGLLRETGSANDLDGNLYPDVIISAPHSDDVVILYSRPIVSINSNITTSPTSIDIVQCALQPNQTCTSFEFCISAREKVSSSRSNFDMDFSIELDPLVSDNTNKRLFFQGETTSTKFFSRFVYSSGWCRTYPVILNINAFSSSSTDDEFGVPLRVQIHYSFTQSHQNTTLSHVLDPLSKQFLVSDWSFHSSCSGRGGFCLYELQTVSAVEYLSPQMSSISSSSSEPYVLGANPGVLNINVTVTNVGPDYVLSSRMDISSGPLVLSKVRGNCVSVVRSSQGFAQLSFSVHKAAILRGYITSGSKCNFVLNYPLQALLESANSSEVVIHGNVYSSSGRNFGLDRNLSNNNFMISRQVRYSVDLALTQTGIPSNVFYNYSTDQAYAQTLNDDILGGSLTDISHSYRILNSGPHILSMASMTFTWPASLTSSRASPLLYLYSFQCNPPSSCQCNSAGKINDFNLSSNNESQTNVSLVFPSPSNVNLSRQTNCKEVHCDVITCSLRNVSPFKSVIVMANFKLWLPTLSQPLLSTTLSSFVRVDASSSLLGETKFPYDSVASTTVAAYVAPEVMFKKSVNIWVIIGAVAGGLLLIAAVVAALWKGGFFSSKYAELTKSAQEQTEMNTSHPDNNVATGSGNENPAFNE